MAFYTIILCATDRKKLLHPVRVRRIENARTWSPTLFCTFFDE